MLHNKEIGNTIYLKSGVKGIIVSVRKLDEDIIYAIKVLESDKKEYCIALDNEVECILTKPIKEMSLRDKLEAIMKRKVTNEEYKLWLDMNNDNEE